MVQVSRRRVPRLRLNRPPIAFEHDRVPLPVYADCRWKLGPIRFAPATFGPFVVNPDTLGTIDSSV